MLAATAGNLKLKFSSVNKYLVQAPPSPPSPSHRPYRTSGAEATQGHGWAAALGPGSPTPTSAPGIALTAATSAPGLGSPRPHLY